MISILLDKWHNYADQKYYRKLLRKLSAILLSSLKLASVFRMHKASSINGHLKQG